MHDSEGDKGVLAHVRRNGKWTLCIHAHEKRTEDCGQYGRRHRRFERHAGRLQDGGIDRHDVGHREKRRQPGNDLAPYCCLLL